MFDGPFAIFLGSWVRDKYFHPSWLQNIPCAFFYSTPLLFTNMQQLVHLQSHLLHWVLSLVISSGTWLPSWPSCSAVLLLVHYLPPSCYAPLWCTDQARTRASIEFRLYLLLLCLSWHFLTRDQGLIETPWGPPDYQYWDRPLRSTTLGFSVFLLSWCHLWCLSWCFLFLLPMVFHHLHRRIRHLTVIS